VRREELLDGDVGVEGPAAVVAPEGLEEADVLAAVGRLDGVAVVGLDEVVVAAVDEEEPGQEKGAKFPTSKAPISVVFHSFRLILGRAIISRNSLEAWVLFPKRARAEHSR